MELRNFLFLGALLLSTFPTVSHAAPAFNAGSPVRFNEETDTRAADFSLPEIYSARVKVLSSDVRREHGNEWYKTTRIAVDISNRAGQVMASYKLEGYSARIGNELDRNPLMYFQDPESQDKAGHATLTLIGGGRTERNERQILLRFMRNLGGFLPGFEGRAYYTIELTTDRPLPAEMRRLQ